MKFCFHEESFILAEKTQFAGITNSLTGDTLAASSRKIEKMNTFKVLEKITEIIGWLQIVASPTLLCCGIGAVIYFPNPSVQNLIIAVCICLLGLVGGILYANKIWKTKGTVWFMSRVSASPELDPENINDPNGK